MNPPSDPATLLTFVTTNEDGSYKINIYGTPAGLRNLAAQLLKQADVDQQPMTYLRDYDTDHTHIKPTYATAILAPSSDELQLGRLDTLKDLVVGSKSIIELSKQKSGSN